jgi:general secretion pathway protein G
MKIQTTIQNAFKLRVANCELRTPARDENPSLVTRNSKLTRAFTLVELLLVLVILGILAALVLPRFGGITQRGRVTAAATQISTFKTALNNFEVDMGYYPPGKSGLDALIHQPRDAKNWHGPYLDSDAVPKDPWGNDYIYECPGRHNPSSFDVMSAGPDGRTGTEDDICNWTLK